MAGLAASIAFYRLSCVVKHQLIEIAMFSPSLWDDLALLDLLLALGVVVLVALLKVEANSLFEDDV